MPTINIIKTVSNLASVTGLSFTATAVQGSNTFPLTASYSAPNLTLTSAGNIGVSGNFTFNVSANYTAFGTACSDSISFVECKTNFITQFRSWGVGNDGCNFSVGVYQSNLASYYSLITNTEFSNNNVTWTAPSELVQNDCLLYSTPPLQRHSKSIYNTSGTIYGKLTFSDGVVLTSYNNWSATRSYVITSVQQLNDFQTNVTFTAFPDALITGITLTYTSGIDNLPKSVSITGTGASYYTYLLNDRIKNQTTVTSTTTGRQGSLYVNFVPEVVC